MKIPAEWPAEFNIAYKIEITRKNTVIGAVEAHLKIIKEE